MRGKPELQGILPAIASPCDEKDMFLEDKFADLATRLMCTNQSACFDVEGTRAALREAAERDGFAPIPHV